MDCAKFEKIIGYTFQNKALLEMALTHTSYANEHGTNSFERLEFLGDSILGFVVAENLYKIHKDKDEGFLSKARAGIVCETSLSAIARKLQIPKYIMLGVGEEKSNGREKNSIISDVVESIIAAIYTDSDFENAKKFIKRIIPEEAYETGISRDFKSSLQETHKHSAIVYKTDAYTQNGADFFKSDVLIDGVVFGRGKGITKKAAEQQAAEQALEKNKQR